MGDAFSKGPQRFLREVYVGISGGEVKWCVVFCERVLGILNSRYQFNSIQLYSAYL